MRRAAGLVATVLVAVAVAAPALTASAVDAATLSSPCLVAGPLPTARAPLAMRFGLTGQAAGSAGVGQANVKPEDPARAFAALDALHRPRRDLVLRLNRMFQSDGAAGIARFAALADAYAARGYRVELQVRYHPPSGQNGDIAAYVAYVRQAVRAFAPRPAVVALSITNEANFVASPNTSDGFYENNVDALVAGIVAAREEADRLGRRDLQLGFTYAYRFVDDEGFFDEIGKRSTPAFQRALDYVGLQAYPGLVYPPPGVQTADQAMVDAATIMRTCLFPRAGIGDRTRIWVTENGYAARRGEDPSGQASRLGATLAALHRVSGTLGITDYRYFNLRDNNSTGSDLFDTVGLLYDDYAPKPAYGVFRDAIDRDGATTPPRACPRRTVVLRPRLRPDERIARAQVRVRGGRVARVRRSPARRTLRVTVARPAGAPAARVLARVRTTSARRLTVSRVLPACPA